MYRLFSITLILGLSSIANAAPVASAKRQVELARVVQVTTLESKGTQVFVSVVDHGGSTDMSTTQTVYLNLYRKGEMFSTDASFEIANVLFVRSVKRLQAGLFQVIAQGFDENAEGSRVRDLTYTIDARGALKAIAAVNCGDEFDCKASEEFRSSVEVSVK